MTNATINWGKNKPIVCDMGDSQGFYEATPLTGNLYTVVFWETSEVLIAEIAPSETFPGFFEIENEFITLPYSSDTQGFLGNIEQYSGIEAIGKLHELKWSV